METGHKDQILKEYFKPIEIVFWVGLIVIPLVAWLLPFSRLDQIQITFLAIASAIFILIVFRVLVPRFGARPWLNYLGIVGSLAIITYLSYLLWPYGVHAEILYVAVIASAGIIAGKSYAINSVYLALLGYFSVTIFRLDSFHPSSLTSLLFPLIVLALGGYVISIITSSVYDQINNFNRQNRYLTTILETGLIASRKDDLHATLSEIAKIICHGLPVTVCRICLLSPDGTRLETYGAYPLRQIDGWEDKSNSCYALISLPALQKALDDGSPIILQQPDLEKNLAEQPHLATFYQGVKSICILPLTTAGTKLGIISIGEARAWDREPYDREKLDLLKTLATQTTAAIHTSRLYEEAQRQLDRMAMLNEVARAIGSTIELDSLLELIYDQLYKVLPSDTYFVSLYDQVEDILDVRILFDKGERYRPKKIPLGSGLSSWVIKHRRALHVRHLSEEWDSLPVKPIMLGKEEMSESWLGVPVIAGNELLGLLAIASYSPNMFDQDDVILLTSVAAQAALAIDNAHHHAEVEEQARRDSLTNAYNHGNFLLRLEKSINFASKINSPVSLIMLDVDYFKDYNDSYGHQVGDDVLQRLVQAILKNITETDTVGRWGGEEFGVILPSTNREQARNIAECIRRTLAEVNIKVSALNFQEKRNRSLGDSIFGSTSPDLWEDVIPNPTISQGVACFPEDAHTAYELVYIADQALYHAKALGRDHIIVANHNPH